jgi:hypothetical protein
VDGEDSFDKAAAILAMRSVTRFTVEDGMPRGAFGRIVRRFYALYSDESPKGIELA